MRTLLLNYVMVREKSAYLAKNRCMNNKWGVVFVGLYRPTLRSVTRGGGYQKSPNIA